MVELLGFGDTGWGDELLRGTGMTILVATCAFLFGLGMGALGAAAKLSHSMVLRALADLYTTVVRGIPELLVIYLLFFGSGAMVRAVASVFGYDEYIEVNAFTVGVVAVGMISGAYSTEVIRGAYLAVPRGQIEAGRALGMHAPLIFRRILVPQTLRFALPGLGNVWQLTLKDTSLISVTALTELMRTAQLGTGVTHAPFLFYGTAALLYMALSSVSTVLFERAERHANRGIRRA